LTLGMHADLLGLGKGTTLALPGPCSKACWMLDAIAAKIEMWKPGAP
jgi:hypothetical protein